jgi:hypothetical protein
MFYIYNSKSEQIEKVEKIESYHLHRNTKLPLISEEESVQSEVEIKKAGRPKSK